ncbi:beta-lactamase/transpeptidase-like protein [Aspergillus transmontanensis]|uniref:Beta-lactamase/transpeptidase-like protein n=1 Tax=Aspergillus transmontanensis TaxID=1034304 RepID=A0A5N6W1F2_9EURO|nr:beta-lactamase/transpeptidase-like protein [Aspergillus transmontanensis]
MTSFDETVNSLRHQSAEDKQPLPRVTLGAINRDGSFHYAKAFGDDTADIADTDAVHWIASLTKFVTTIAVMQCVERGQLDLDSDIGKVLPEWQNPQILTGFNEKDEPIFRPATKAITLRQVICILRPYCGMAYVFMHPLLTRYQQLQGERPLIQQTVKESYHPFLLFEPGERWLYSPSIDWAGVAVERVTSMKLGEYMERHIFDVVSAKDVTFHLDQREDLRTRKAKNWERAGQTLEEEKNPVMPDPIAEEQGGGGLYATVNEMLKIYRGVLTEKLLRPETIKVMFQPQLETASGLDKPHEYPPPVQNAIWNAVPHDVPVSFGLGGLVNSAAVPGQRGVNSLTWSGIPNCYWWIDIENGVAGIYLSQLVPMGDQKSVQLLTEFENELALVII